VRESLREGDWLKLWSLIFRLLSVLAIVGLSTAPMVIPSGGAMAEDASSMAAMADVSSMGDDMNCCPHQKQSLPDCQASCALAACMMSMFANAPIPAAFTIIRSSKAERMTPRDALLRDPLAHPPPPRPPRT
jgi:hypothetical protein